jgi:hypothetical protein
MHLFSNDMAANGMSVASVFSVNETQRIRYHLWIHQRMQSLITGKVFIARGH